MTKQCLSKVADKTFYPQPWVCSDPDCSQYVRKVGTYQYQLIQIDPMPDYYTDDDLCLVAEDTIDLAAILFSPDELKTFEADTLHAYSYTSFMQLVEVYGNWEAALQIAAECAFESSNHAYTQMSMKRHEAEAYIQTRIRDASTEQVVGILHHTGVIHRIDDLGRVCIPKAVRSQLEIQENDPFEIMTLGDDKVVIQKYKPGD